MTRVCASRFWGATDWPLAAVRVFFFTRLSQNAVGKYTHRHQGWCFNRAAVFFFHAAIFMCLPVAVGLDYCIKFNCLPRIIKLLKLSVRLWCWLLFPTSVDGALWLLQYSLTCMHATKAKVSKQLGARRCFPFVTKFSALQFCSHQLKIHLLICITDLIYVT